MKTSGTNEFYLWSDSVSIDNIINSNTFWKIIYEAAFKQKSASVEPTMILWKLFKMAVARVHWLKLNLRRALGPALLSGKA